METIDQIISKDFISYHAHSVSPYEIKYVVPQIKNSLKENVVFNIKDNNFYLNFTKVIQNTELNNYDDSELSRILEIYDKAILSLPKVKKGLKGTLFYHKSKVEQKLYENDGNLINLVSAQYSLVKSISPLNKEKNNMFSHVNAGRIAVQLYNQTNSNLWYHEAKTHLNSAKKISKKLKLNEAIHINRELGILGSLRSLNK